MAVNFRHEDYIQIFLIGLKYYTTGIWPFWGPDIVWTSSQIPGALQGILIAWPLFIFKLPEIPFIFLNLISILSLSFFAWYLLKRIKGIPPFFVWIWLFIAPWLINYSTTIINPSYVLPAAILFFIGIFEIYPFYKNKLFSDKLSFFLIGFAIVFIFQLHLSWVLLPPYIALAFYFEYKKTGFKEITVKALYFLLGLVISLVTLVPTFIKFGFVASENVGSNIVFNSRNLYALFDILMRFMAFAGFEVRKFMGGNAQDDINFLLKNIWVSPFIIFVFVTGILQTLYLIIHLFLKHKAKEWNKVRIFTVLTVIFLYISYLFSVRLVGSHTFYLFIPIVIWYSFYCWQKLFEKKFWHKFAIIFLFSGVVFHITLALNNFDNWSLYSCRNKITQAIKEKDSRIFAYRRIHYWEKVIWKKGWKEKEELSGNIKKLCFENNFEYDKSAIPEKLTSKISKSGNYSCRIDSLKPISFTFNKPLRELKIKNNIDVSFYKSGKSYNEDMLVFALEKNRKTTVLKNYPLVDYDSNNWKKTEFSYILPSDVDTASNLKIYVYRSKKQKNNLYIDDFKISFY